MDRPFVSIHPDVQGGAPCLNGTRLPVSSLVAFVARGIPAYEIEDVYEVTLRDVQVACWYAATYGKKKYRKAWGDWARHWRQGLPGAIA